MTATVHTLRLSKHGIPPLVFFSEYVDVRRYFCVEAQIAWPTPQVQGGASIVRVVRLTALLNSSEDPSQRADAANVIRLAAKEAVLQFGAEAAAAQVMPAEDIVLGDVDGERLRAWRSLGYFEGLDRAEMPGPARTLINKLPEPVYFEKR